MNSRIGLIFASLSCFAFSSGAVVRGEEPEKQAPPAQPVTTSVIRAQEFLNLQRAFNPTQVYLTLETWSNALGMNVGEIDAALRSQLDLEEGRGVLVTGVNAESDAAKAGIQQHDLLISIDDQAVSTAQQFQEAIQTRSGKGVQFRLVRKGKPVTLSLTIGATPVYEIANVHHYDVKFEAQPQYRIGVSLSLADDTLRSQLGLAVGEGLVVTETIPDSPATEAGIRQHDLLTKLDGKRLTTVDAVNAQIQEIKDRKVAVSLFRGGHEITVEVTPKLYNDSQAYMNTVWSVLLQENAVRADLDAALLERQFSYWPYRLMLTNSTSPAEAPASNPAEQLATLKKQLVDMQKSLDALETLLREKPQEPAAAPQGEPKK